MDNKKWAEFYSSDRDNISKRFVKVKTSDGKHWFFSKYDIWYEIKEHCEKNHLIVEDLHLQFRTNKCIIDVSDADGIYLVRSVLGAIGQPTKNYFTVGVLRGDTVHKQMWLLPELILDKEYEDNLSGCFEEALIRYDKKKQVRQK